MRDSLHESAVWPLVGTLEHSQLLDNVVGVLTRDARKRVLAQSSGAVAGRASRYIFGWHTASEDYLAAGNA